MPSAKRLVNRNPVVREILRQGRKQPRKRVKAALETGRVESNFTNVQGGDADSVNWRQERASIYGGDMSIRRSVRRFYNEAEQHDARGKPARELAADVQRPAEQYRSRYGQVAGEAEAILRAARGGGSSGGGTRARGTRLWQPPRTELSQTTAFDKEGFEQAQRRAAVGQFLQSRGRGSGILFRTGLLGGAAPSREDFTSTELESKLIPGRMVPGRQRAAAAPSGSQVQTAVRAARKRLGVTEVSGSNRGPQVDRMQRRFGMIGQPWCGIFVGTALQKAGVKGVTSRVASVAFIEEDAKQGANGFRSWHSPKDAERGDALVTRQAGHVGFIVKVDRKRGLIHTIEGNTGNGEVARRTHRMQDVYGAARPRYGRKRK